MSLLTHVCLFVSFFFFPGIQFSRLLSGLSSFYFYRKVQFLFCLGFSCSSHGNEVLSYFNLNQKSPVFGILLYAFSSQQNIMDIFVCEHKKFYLIILEFKHFFPPKVMNLVKYYKHTHKIKITSKLTTVNFSCRPFC